MKLSFAFALAFLRPNEVPAFSPSTTSNARLGTSSLSSTAEPPERLAPDAGYVPDWEDRSGLSPNKFMSSDMSKPDLSGMWECPLTRWDSDGYVTFRSTKKLLRS